MFFVTNFTISGHENVHFVHGRDGRQKVMVSDNFCINSVHPSPNAFAPADGDGWDGETLVQPLFSLQKNWFFSRQSIFCLPFNIMNSTFISEKFLLPKVVTQ